MSDSVVRICRALRYDNGKKEVFEEPVAVETGVTLYLNGIKHISIVVSAESLEEFGAGYVTAAGLARKVSSVTVRGTDIFVEAEVRNEPVPHPSPGGCQITPDDIFSICSALDTDVWEKTGGLHSAVLYHNHKPAAVFSDIGRHNAADKAVGFMVLHGIPPEECILGSTGRQPRGMVEKAVNSGISVIVSRAAATVSGISFAEKQGITLISFARGGRFTVYSHPERVCFDR